MASARRRRLLVWTAIPLLVAQVGCAGRGVRVAEVAAGPPTTVSEADQKACEQYSKRQKQKSVVGISVLGVALLPVSTALSMAALITLSPGAGMVVANVRMLEEAGKSAQQNQATRQAALQACLEPLILEQTLGPEHPDLARSLDTLATGYVAISDLTKAEPLYQRALAIGEKALGPEDLDVAKTLEDYAALLRKAHRQDQAEAMEARAKAIRAKHEQQSQNEPEPEPSTPQEEQPQ